LLRLQHASLSAGPLVPISASEANFETEARMRVFAVSLIAVAVLATAWSFTLNHFQETVAQATTGNSVRLDYQEAVNPIGREANPS
jgi:Tfp pilus assembly protein PilO